MTRNPKFIIFCIILILSNSKIFGQNSSGIYINEFVASNSSITIPGHAVLDDWIEIYNSNNTPYDLSSHYITDNLSQPKKFRLSTVTGSLVIPAHGYVVIICSNNISLGANHVTFSLSANGEAIGLYAPDGITKLDSYTFGYQRADISMGRNPQNLTEWKYLKNVTIGGINNFSITYSEVLPPPTFSKNSGFYTSGFNLTLGNSISGANIYYTLDGSEPNPADTSGVTFIYKNSYPELPNLPFGNALTKSYSTFKYVSSIPINERSSMPNDLANIASSYQISPYYIPTNLIKKSNVVRAVLVKNGALPSEIITKSYFVWANGNTYNVPLISLNLPAKSLFSYEEGIYTAGTDFDGWRTQYPMDNVATGTGANYNRRGEMAERVANIEYFENSLVKINQQIGIRINGSGSRLYPVKSIRLSARSKYGKSGMDFPFYSDQTYTSYKSLILRNSGQDYNKTLFRDGLIHDFSKGLNLTIMNYKPAILFINGEYWGIHNIRERLDNNYYEQHFAIPEDSLDLIEISGGETQLQDGTLTNYNNLIDYLKNNSLVTDTKYDYINTRLDIENVIDYYTTEMFIGNHDWMYNNVTMWRYSGVPNTSEFGKDGKWRYSLNDLDFGLGSYTSYTFNMFSFVESGGLNRPVFPRLIENAKFKQLFINRFADLLNTHFSASRIESKINAMKLPLVPIIQEHTERWKNILNYNNWDSEITKMITYVYNKVPEQRNQIKTRFGISATHNLTIDVSSTNEGYVRVNTIDILASTPGVNSAPYPWTGVYFNNIPFNIYAKSKPNFKFKHWLVNNVVVSTDSVLQVNLTANKSYKAVFESTIYSDNPLPIAKVFDKCGYKLFDWTASSQAFPPNTIIAEMQTSNPTISTNIAGATSGIFNLSTGTRANANEIEGISFVNSDISNTGYAANKIGGLLVAMNTTNYDSIYVSWIGRTIQPNSKEYKIRLQYRLGDLQPFNNLLDASGNIVEYQRSATAGQFMEFKNIKLPSAICNKPYVQLFWRFYYTGVQNDILNNVSDELGIDDIEVYSKKVISGTTITSTIMNQHSQIISNSRYGNLLNNQLIATKSIELLNGFYAENGTIFKAEIETCD